MTGVNITMKFIKKLLFTLRYTWRATKWLIKDTVQTFYEVFFTDDVEDSEYDDYKKRLGGDL